MKTMIKGISVLFMGALIVSCGENKKELADNSTAYSENTKTLAVNEAADPSIAAVASSNENFSTLVAALSAADLVSTLDSEGPFTVFAPTNDAFAKLPEGTVEELLKPENREKLTSILTYHVVAGEYNAEAVINAIKKNNGSFTAPTIEGGRIVFTIENGNVILTDVQNRTSTVVTPDVDASNGVIHSIDTVIMP